MAQPSIPFFRRWRRQRGVFAVLLAPLLLGLVLCMGVVLDIAQVHHRRTELQNVADGAALAAARQLDGTPAGIALAQAEAGRVVAANRVGYGGVAMVWDNAALGFADAPGGGAGWVDAATANAAPANYWFARVDTAALAGANVATPFMRSVDSAVGVRSAAAHAVAGHTSINLAPLAICVMSTAPTAVRSSGGLNEQVEFGFRRGVGYNLLALNPTGPAARNYVINPLATPPAASAPANFGAAVLNPFMCSGSVPMARVPASVYVSAISPAQFAYAAQLNSRFGPSGGCENSVGVADNNVKPYPPTPSGQTAVAATTGSATALRTKADLPVPLPSAASETVEAKHYGPLWGFSRPLTPAGAPFALTDWPTLYRVNSGADVAAPGNYPASGAPYTSLAIAWFLSSSIANPRLPGRRVLNVALLNCTLPTAPTATVLAVGRFYMTAQASATAISGEFAGVAAPAALGGPVGLFR
ncbi:MULTISPECIES: pilus assembly protein TadG-related protein [unclassified Janthinobacterium]|uniref:pilus assembly protein TadG-related protein n=1 Tax=unclassified Janthinobacterium TaxID=2610881 RepID=UPI00034DA306|nr:MULTISPECIES: pilus assembly protein TadG-related protein [unclassified Janthinobacterium]MEC5158918.1 Flp pilus assembly protein TadG [Janthinobacterium sp. CG_S6]